MKHRFCGIGTMAVASLMIMHGFAAAQKTVPSPESETTSAGSMQVKSLRELDDDDRTAQWNNLTVDQLEEMDIVNQTGEQVGEVEEVLADGQGNIVAITAEVGGFLGIGEKEVIVPLDQLNLQGDKLMTTLSAKQLEAMLRWDDD